MIKLSKKSFFLVILPLTLSFVFIIIAIALLTREKIVKPKSVNFVEINLQEQDKLNENTIKQLRGKVEQDFIEKKLPQKNLPLKPQVKIKNNQKKIEEKTIFIEVNQKDNQKHVKIIEYEQDNKTKTQKHQDSKINEKFNENISKQTSLADKLEPEQKPSLKNKKIAIVIAGMGLSKKTTEMAILNLPKQIDFAFVPYAYMVKKQVANARKYGHEILLQIPLEPYGYPDNDPGPHTLLQELTDDENIKRLNWLMNRFDNYVGITNYMGEKFASSEHSMELLLKHIAKNKLLYFDNGVALKNKVRKIAKRIGVSHSFADLVIDVEQDEQFIQESLEQLEEIANQRGYSIGFANAFPLSIKQITKWVENLKTRGFNLVPLSLLHDEQSF